MVPPVGNGKTRGPTLLFTTSRLLNGQLPDGGETKIAADAGVDQADPQNWGPVAPGVFHAEPLLTPHEGHGSSPLLSKAIYHAEIFER